MKIALITDAWAPQVNGVVRTLLAITRLLGKWGHEVLVISPDQYRSIPCPSYPEIRLAIGGGPSVGSRIESFAPEAVHIATEGPLGLAARRHCISQGRAVHHRLSHPFPGICRAAHRSAGIAFLGLYPLVPSAFRRHNGGDRKRPGRTSRARSHSAARMEPRRRPGRISARRSPRPTCSGSCRVRSMLYVGRVAVEKNIEVVLALQPSGLKGRRGRWPGAGQAARRISGCTLPWPPSRAGIDRLLCRGGCIRLPQPHRHIRPGHDRGAGVRYAGRRLSRHGAGRYSDA